MPLFAVEYNYEPAAAAGRDDVRPAHRAWLRGLLEQNVLMLSGPYPDGSGALLIFAGSDESAVRKILSNDPFAVAGLIESAKCIEWTLTMGALSADD